MRNPSLRQLEALSAVIETGTVSGAAEVLYISQPAASKLIRDIEADTGLELFERESGRLVPTGLGMQLYEEVDRVLGGVNQLGRAVKAIRRENRGQVLIGTMPGLSGPFLCRVLARFRIQYPEVYVAIEARSSQYLAEAVLQRRLDLAIIHSRSGRPSLQSEPLHNQPMVCILPKGHRLAALRELGPRDLSEEPFIAFTTSGLTRLKVDAVFKSEGVKPNIVIEATTAQNVSELVAAGFGVTVTDPLFIQTVSDRVEIRPFRPETTFEFKIVRPSRARNSTLANAFVRAAQEETLDSVAGRQRSPVETPGTA